MILYGTDRRLWLCLYKHFRTDELDLVLSEKLPYSTRHPPYDLLIGDVRIQSLTSRLRACG
jgi:hypothetical protein